MKAEHDLEGVDKDSVVSKRRCRQKNRSGNASVMGNQSLVDQISVLLMKEAEKAVSALREFPTRINQLILLARLEQEQEAVEGVLNQGGKEAGT